MGENSRPSCLQDILNKEIKLLGISLTVFLSIVATITHIIAAEQASVSPSGLVIEEGKNAEFASFYRTASPARVAWYHYEKSSDRSSGRIGNLSVYSVTISLQNSRSFLWITNASLRHTGTYKCSINGSQGSADLIVVKSNQRVSLVDSGLERFKPTSFNYYNNVTYELMLNELFNYLKISTELEIRISVRVTETEINCSKFNLLNDNIVIGNSTSDDKNYMVSLFLLYSDIFEKNSPCLIPGKDKRCACAITYRFNLVTSTDPVYSYTYQHVLTSDFLSTEVYRIFYENQVTPVKPSSDAATTQPTQTLRREEENEEISYSIRDIIPHTPVDVAPSTFSKVTTLLLSNVITESPSDVGLTSYTTNNVTNVTPYTTIALTSYSTSNVTLYTYATSVNIKQPNSKSVYSPIDASNTNANSVSLTLVAIAASSVTGIICMCLCVISIIVRAIFKNKRRTQSRCGRTSITGMNQIQSEEESDGLNSKYLTFTPHPQHPALHGKTNQPANELSSQYLAFSSHENHPMIQSGINQSKAQFEGTSIPLPEPLYEEPNVNHNGINIENSAEPYYEQIPYEGVTYNLVEISLANNRN